MSASKLLEEEKALPKVSESALGIPVQTGGVETALQNEAPPETAIVAVGVEQLSSVARKLIQAGTKRILLEKPGGMTLDELQNLNSEVLVKPKQTLCGSLVGIQP